MITIKNKQCKRENILKEYPNAEIYGMTNRCGVINEYNFGVGTPDVKSIWNTLDFEPTQIIRENGKIKKIIKTSPFAYNSNNNKDRNNYA